MESVPNAFGNLKAENPIPEIWLTIKGRAAELSCEQFFGLNPAVQLSGGNGKATAFYPSIIACYTTLNFVGYNTDKGVARPGSTAKIMSDAIHTANAAFCDLLVSADQRLCAKASAIYKYIGAGTQVAQVEIASP